MRSTRLFLLAVTGVMLMLVACTDDECVLTCPAGQACINDSGVDACRTLCGGQLCTAGQACEAEQCVSSSVCSPNCPLGQHCVFGDCVEDYTSQNVCDPLRQCRRNCEIAGSNLSACTAACEADTSTACSTCQGIRADCESRESCGAGNIGPYTECCESQFCDCFPSHPACGNVLPCAECAEECGDDTTCFNSCVQGEPACSTCLQPFFDCGGDASCQAEFCDCVSDPACP
ncbi:MAG: hypothetical protein ACJA1R_000725 [Flavobacteriales bacterium]|jgi:hypothetical protein